MTGVEVKINSKLDNNFRDQTLLQEKEKNHKYYQVLGIYRQWSNRSLAAPSADGSYIFIY